MAKGLIAKDRSVLRLSGADAPGFLQDLVTNDITGATADRAVYAALLTPQGKYLFDFLVLGDDQGLLLDVDGARAPALAQRLRMYTLRRDVAIAETDMKVGLIWGGAAPPTGGIEDPRDPRLGWRLYGAAPDLAGTTRVAPEVYREHMIACDAPQTGQDLRPEDGFILEYGFERLNGVDFRKGCYVGQEIVARMKHKATLKKGLRRVSVTGPAPEPGADILSDGKPAGSIGAVAGGSGLALLRLDRAEGALTCGEATLKLL